MKSPFIYGNIVNAKSFTDREVECEHLANNLLSGINTMVISPRRWGKSSFVSKVFNDISLNNTAIRTVVIDLFSVSSEEEFLELFAKEIIKTSSSKWKIGLIAAKSFLIT